LVFIVCAVGCVRVLAHGVVDSRLSYLLAEAQSLHIPLDIFDLDLVELVNQHAGGSKLVIGDADGAGHLLRAGYEDLGDQAAGSRFWCSVKMGLPCRGMYYIN
jgi:hypothetical protein